MISNLSRQLWRASRLRGLFALLVATAMVGCTPAGRHVRGFEEYPMVHPDLDPEVAQLLMQEYVASAVEILRSGVDEAAERTLDEARRTNLRRFEESAIAGVRRAGLRLQPIPAAYDSWVYLDQLIDFVASERGAEIFGPDREAVQGVLVGVERCFDSVVEQIVLDLDRAEEELVRGWVADHPMTELDLSRLSPLIAVADDTDRIGDTFEVLANTQFIATAAYARLHDALLSLPADLRRQVEFAVRGLLREPVVASALVGLARLGDGMKELAAVAEAFDREFDVKLRGLSIDLTGEIDRQRQDTIVALQSERVVVTELLLRQEERLIGEMDRQIGGFFDRSHGLVVDASDRLHRSMTLVAITVGLGAGVLGLSLIAAGLLAGRGRSSPSSKP